MNMGSRLIASNFLQRPFEDRLVMMGPYNKMGRYNQIGPYNQLF